MAIQKINTTQIVNMIIKDQLISLSLLDMNWIVDKTLWKANVDPNTIPIEEKQFIVSQWKAKLQTMIDKL